jgi:hypothetical protein
VQLEGLPALVQAVLSNDPNVQLEATTQFRKLLSIGEIRILCVAVSGSRVYIYQHRSGEIWAIGFGQF